MGAGDCVTALEKSADLLLCEEYDAGKPKRGDGRVKFHINHEVKTKRGWPMVVFGLVFFLVGAGFLVMSVIPTLHDGWQMQSWFSVQGRMLSADLRVNRSDDSTTYQAVGRYAYEVGGRHFENDRVAINSGSDNIGDFQQRLASKLRHHQHNHYPITVWYNPSNPADSVINRDIRWGLLVFKLVFVIVFGGVGLGVIVFSLKGKKVVDSPEAQAKPWLANPDWQDGVIRSGAKTGMVAIWGFATVWNLISFPIAIMAVPEILSDKEYIGLFVLLFPVVGLGLIAWAIKLTLEWKRFGTTPLTMDPFPGAIGGDVGGGIQINMPYDASLACKVTLSCIHSYVSGSGKNRSRSESVKWQDEGYARVRPSAKGVELQFRFEVPDGLPVSEEHGSSYHLWRLHVEADIPGVDLDRSFEIPVYATGEHSGRLGFRSSEEQPAGAPSLTAESLLPIREHGGVKELYYPMMRKPGRSLGLMVFGAIFAGVGVFLWTEAAREGFMLYMMSSVFSLVGWAIVLGGIYSALNSLRVTLDGRAITSERALLGIPVSHKAFEYDDVMSVEASEGMKSNSGQKHTIEYSIVAKLPGDKITLAEHLGSSSKKDLVVEYFEQEFLGRQASPRFEL